MPFRQIFTVLLALIAVLLAALLVLSWDSDDPDDASTQSDAVDNSDDESDSGGSTSSTTSPPSTLAPVTTTSILVECATEDDSTDVADTTTTSTTTVATEGSTTSTTPTTTEPVEPLVPTLGRNSSLSTVGLDTVAFGLTVNQATTQSGHEMIACGAVTDCYRVTPHRAPSGISFVVHEGTIERVDIVGDSPITTLSGAGIGTTEEKLDSLFGDQLERVDLGGGQTDVIFVPADENDQEFRVAFTLVDGVVETLRAGRVPLVLEPNPCA